MMHSYTPALYIVLPCYNEEDVISDSIEKLIQSLDKLVKDHFVSDSSKLLFVDDGSIDHTWKIILDSKQKNEYVEGIRLSRNKGHQIAICAGMEVAKDYADIVITMDVDLQQDINVLPDFVKKYYEGFDIVYGIRNDRKTDGVFKKTTASIYYKLMKRMGVEIIPQSADYRLLSRKAVESLCQFKENNLFIRGIVPILGFKSSYVYFDVKERSAGKSKYTLKKMIRLALDGITSFSIAPIRIAFAIGILASLTSLGMALFDLAMFFKGAALPGWTSITVSIWFLGGVQLMFLGVIGEYVGRTYIESKKRPRYFIDEITLDSATCNNDFFGGNEK